jgi:bifunctional enzyme CysN/CysC
MARSATTLAPRDHDQRVTASISGSLENRSLLRFLTCGSVDDGKSTLIGRLLYDSRLVFEDQLAALAVDSRRYGTNGGDLDLALLVDGLEAEREQGITIDVAYRFFSTPKRKFIVADTPGHEQYTRNMATGASSADLAIVLVDARQGILTQTRRHTFIAALLGIRHVVLAVNKIDLVDYSRDVFRRIEADYRSFAGELGFASIEALPISARHGDNVTTPSERLSWHEGPTLLGHLETVEVEQEGTSRPFRFPIQYVNRPNADFRGFAGTVASGSIAIGDEVTVAKSGAAARVRRIVGPGSDLARAQEGQAVTLLLDREIELARGNMLVEPTARPHVADRIRANLIWFDEKAMQPGRSYLLRSETDQVAATISGLEHRIDVNSFERDASDQLAMNEVGVVDIALQAPLAFDNFADNPRTGAFVLIDRLTNATAGAGMILQPLATASNVHRHAIDVDGAARAAIKQQRPAVIWLTGLSGSGKSTIANLLDARLHAAGRHAYVLDGDNLRHGLNRDLGFSDADRAENIRRVAEVARLMADAGLIVIVSFISPFRADREQARQLFEEGRFVEVHVDTSLDECIRRDPKGLYSRALKGEITNFTGLDSPYEVPSDPEIHLRTEGADASQLAGEIFGWLEQRRYF